MYKHGIEVSEKQTAYERPLATRYGVQVVTGTAPVNLVENGAVNQPVKVSSFDEAKAALGYSDDWESYTLCQSMKACFEIFKVYPVIFINVLDPQRHKKDVEAGDHEVANHQAVLETGVLKGSVTVKASAQAEAALEDKDYILSFAEDGRLLITLLSSGILYKSSTVNVSYTRLDPQAVTEEDIIGARDMETWEETGLEAIRQVYPRYGITPALLLAPGWSHRPNVGAALMGKCEGLNGVFRCECILDMAAENRKYTECRAWNEAAGYTAPHAFVLWPMALYEGKRMYFSAVYGAMASYYTAVNGDVPYVYPSNKLLGIQGAVLEDGGEVVLDQLQAAELNGDGIVTLLNDGGWKAWGNNTGAYPGTEDPKDRFIGCRKMFSFAANYFITQFKSRLDESMNRNTIDDIVNGFNIWGNSLKSQGQCAGLRMAYLREENTGEDLANGHVKLRIYLAPYTPLEAIEAVAEFDMETLRNAVAGEEEERE